MRPSTTRRAAAVWRRVGQGLFFGLFLFLFLKTDYAGSDELTWAVNLLFRIDPFLAVSAMLAAKTVIALLLPALITLVLTLVFGRFFCGWICPLGTLIDICGRLVPPQSPRLGPTPQRMKYVLLLFLLTAAFCGLPAAGYIDPFSLLVRGLAFAVHPALDAASTALFTFTYQHGPAWLNTLTEPVYGLLKSAIFPSATRVYGLSLFSLLLLVIVLGLSAVDRRFFCRTLCPLGTLLAVCARFSLFRLLGGTAKCGKCRQCRSVCRMGAIDDDRAIAAAECTLCLECLDACPTSRIRYGRRDRTSNEPAVDLSRRAVLTGVAAGVLAPMALPTRLLSRTADPLLIRPPGALEEEAFLDRCVRCGECMKVCIGNALHAVWLEAGIAGIFTPRLIGRIGYCEYNCTLCGQVCPTGAIRKLSRNEKHTTVIGRAVFNTNRCLPYAQAIPCIVCEEHCPTPDKAIKFREVSIVDTRGEPITLRQPYVVGELCIGCGICENKCPLSGASAVTVTTEGESRQPARTGSGGY